jgi:Tellurite resistance protein TerB
MSPRIFFVTNSTSWPARWTSIWHHLRDRLDATDAISTPRAIRRRGHDVMNDRLLELYRGVAIHATANIEHRAALQLLALVMLSDDHIDDLEVDAVREISSEWRGDDFAFEDHLRPAIESARRAIETDRVAEYLDEIDATISSRVLRSALFSAARDVAGANHDVTPDEGTILAEVAVRFD